ncbi:periplasmic protein TonB [Tenacibaculum sp. 190524A02b]|uniref:Periplasmic protein TonB n=1 Tax=Tenacibaculum vairaonense TaxID=3137860 RepID=A0ABP1FGR3_9FLAO
MNQKLKYALLPLFMVTVAFSQSTKTCSSPDDDTLADLNSITKCSIDKSKDDKEQKISVEIVTRKRIVRKRNKATGLTNQNNHSHKLAAVKKKVDVVNTIIDNSNKEAVPDILPFSYVDQIPLFKKCESVPILTQSKCFRSQVMSHIKRNMKYPEIAYKKGIQGKVYVHFIINKDGNIDELKVVPPYKGELLGKEAERIIKKLPKLTPGEHKGNPVVVKYGLPITFKIPGVKRTNIRKVSANKKIKEVIYSFSSLDEIPKFDACEKSNDDTMSCFNKNLIRHIEKHFAYPEEAKLKGIQGNVMVNFVINKEGNITDITSNGSESGKILELAAVKLVEKLPKLNPAKKAGKNVNTSYSFPINFKLD